MQNKEFRMVSVDFRSKQFNSVKELYEDAGFQILLDVAFISKSSLTFIIGDNDLGRKDILRSLLKDADDYMFVNDFTQFSMYLKMMQKNHIVKNVFMNELSVDAIRPILKEFGISYDLMAIIGSRSCDYNGVLEYSKRIPKNSIVRSGNATGADQAAKMFDTILDYLPYPSYNKALLSQNAHYIVPDFDLTRSLYGEEIKTLFPWIDINGKNACYILRNMTIINGLKKDKKVDVVYYWADETVKDGKLVVSGGTNYGVQYALSLGIPCINLKNNARH